MRRLRDFVGALGLVLAVAGSPALAALIQVTTTNDILANEGACSLREAVIAANTDTASGGAVGECAAGSGADTIQVPAGLYTLSLIGDGEENAATGDLDLLGSVSIVGASARTTFIDAAASDRIFDIDSFVITVSLSGFTIQNGNVIDDGGAILNVGTLNIDSCTIRNSESGLEGGAIETSGDVTITNSTLNSNIAGGDGGAIEVSGGTLLLRNCTLSGNFADGDGGGINDSGGDTTLNNVTIAGNTADSGDGGGISELGGTITARNTIIAANIDTDDDAPDCSGTLTSEGYNLIQDTSLCTISGTLTGNTTGSSAQLLGLLNNGGETDTRALLASSPALDSGNPAVPGSGGTACEAADQRAQARPQDGNGDSSAVCDKGAYELFLPPTPTPTVTAPPTQTPTFTPTVAGSVVPTPTSTPTRTVTSTPTFDPNLCFVIGEASNALISVHKKTRAIQTIATISGATGIQAVVMSVAGQTLYAAAGDQLGTVGITSGVFTPTSSTFGSGDGPNGIITFDEVVGLAFDPRSGLLYGVHQEAVDEDVLIRIDPTTGASVPGSFNLGLDDYAPISGCLDDVEDITIDKRGGVWAVTNDDEEDDELAEVDLDTGDCTSVGPIEDSVGNPIWDMGGLAFHSDNQLWGTTAANSGGNADKFWRINKSSAVATLWATLPPGGDDEALTCQQGGCMPILKVRHAGLVIGGTTFNYRFLWLNRCDTFPATGVVVTNTLPSDLELLSVNAAVPYTVVGNTVTFNVGTLVKSPAGLATVTVRIKPTAGVGRTIQNKAVMRDSYGREVIAIDKFKVK